MYVTNAVKHFKYEQRGKRRIHQTPHAAELDACRWWLDAELAVIKPDVLVCLGATAARSLFGRPVTISGSARDRGRGREWQPVAGHHPPVLSAAHWTPVHGVGSGETKKTTKSRRRNYG